jgi:hypothetical protein
LLGTTQTALVAVRDEATHAQFRRPVAHAYSLSSLKGYEPYIDSQITQLVSVLDSHANNGKPINMSDWLHCCAAPLPPANLKPANIYVPANKLRVI